MINSHVNHAWQFECVMPSGSKLQSWFYADTKDDAVHRIKEYMEAKLISIKEIDDPLDTAKKQAESDKVRETLARKQQEQQQLAEKKNNE